MVSGVSALVFALFLGPVKANSTGGAQRNVSHDVVGFKKQAAEGLEAPPPSSPVRQEKRGGAATRGGQPSFSPTSNQPQPNFFRSSLPHQGEGEAQRDPDDGEGGEAEAGGGSDTRAQKDSKIEIMGRANMKFALLGAALTWFGALGVGGMYGPASLFQ